MPTYRLTAPDGKVYNVTGDGTGEEALAQLQQQLAGAPPQNSAPSAVAQPDAPEEAMGDRLKRYMKEAAGGAEYGLHRASAGLTGLLPRAAEEFLVKKGLSPSQEMLDSGKKFVADTGPASTIGQMGADIATQLMPGGAVTKSVAAMPTLSRAAFNMVGQGAVNSAMTPTEEGRGMSAAVGAGAAGVGAGVSRLFGGPIRKMISPEGQKLLDAGIPLTPGQAVSGPNANGWARTLRATEDAAGSIPGLGDLLRAKAHSAVNAFSTGEINKALAPIGRKIMGVGHEAVDEAHDAITKHYSTVLPEIHVPVASLPNLVDDAIAQVKATNPLFNTQQEETLRLYDGRRIQEFVAGGQDLSGTSAKKLDEELGQYIRKFNASGKNSVFNADMADAFKAVRDKLRDAMVGTTPEARQALKDADKARAKLQSILTSADDATGLFTAKGLVKADAKVDVHDPFRQAAASVLPTITPDSGTAGRTMMGRVLSAPTLGAGAAGAGSVMLAGALPTLAGIAGVSALYTKPGMKFLAEGTHPVLDKLRSKANVSRDELEQFMQFISSQPIRAGFNAKGE
jgi:hypothetical protein